MANNIVALNLNGNEYNFRPLYSVESSDSLGADYSFELDDFAAVDGATFLLYFTATDLYECDAVITFQTTMDGDRWWRVFYGTNELAWKDLAPYNLYEFSCHVDSDGFYLTGNIPYSPIKYRDNKNQLQEKSIGNGVIDLSSGVYYATTSATASRVANTLTLIDANGDRQIYNGSNTIDLSAGVNYADSARYATDAGRAGKAGIAGWADDAGEAGSAYRLKECDAPIPGEHISGEYCHIAGVSVFALAEANYSMLFTGYGYNGLQDAPWSGILYFEWNAQSLDNVNASAKWMCLTREDISNNILLTVEDGSSDMKALHIWFAYPNTYASANVTLIKGSDLHFDIHTSTSLIGTTIATSTFSSSSNYFKYGVHIPQGAWAGRFDLSSRNDFIFECDDTVEMGPRQNGDGVYVKLSTEYKRKISSLENYILTLVAENQRQIQQINDLKSVLTEITTGKTWDSNIWGGSGGATTGGIGGVETTPEMTTPKI